MSKRFQLPSPDPDRFTLRIRELREAFACSNPYLLADRIGANYEAEEENTGRFCFRYWGKQILVRFPNFVAYQEPDWKETSTIDLALLLFYFNTANGIPLSDHWISFSELPEGKFYNQAFQSYTGQRLVQVFQNNPQDFERASIRLDGIRLSHGDVSYMYQVLPRIRLMVVYWQGDEDFPSNFQILFDASASHYLPTDGYAILGSTLTRRLISMI